MNDMDFGQVKEEHRKLAVFAGTWSGKETIHPSPWDPKGGTSQGRTDARLALDGFALVTDYEQERDGKIVFRGHGVYGWDPFERCYVMHWVDNVGGTVHLTGARGEWRGSQLVFTASSPRGHGRYTYMIESETRYRFRIDMSPDGQNWMPFLEATYTKG